MRNRVLKISELEWRRKNLYRNKTKKISYYIYFSDWDFGELYWSGLDCFGRSEDGDVGLVDLFLFGWLWMGWLVLDWRGCGWRGR